MWTMSSVLQSGDMDLETQSVVIQKIGSHSVKFIVHVPRKKKIRSTMKGKIDGYTHIVNLNVAFVFII